MYDCRKKPYQLGDGISVNRWKRRSRLIARDAFAEGKRDDTFSPATSGHVQKLLILPTIFCKEDEAREGDFTGARMSWCEGCISTSSTRETVKRDLEKNS